MIKAVQFKLIKQSSNRRSAYSYEDHERYCMNNTIYCIYNRNIIIVYILLSFEMREQSFTNLKLDPPNAHPPNHYSKPSYQHLGTIVILSKNQGKGSLYDRPISETLIRRTKKFLLHFTGNAGIFLVLLEKL